MTFKLTAQKFTKDQREAYNFLMDFIDNDEPFAVLAGAAGTGKTYLLRYFLDNIDKKVCVTAPTHKAVRVIKEITGRSAKTFHSLHGLRPNVDIAHFDISKPQYEALGEPKIKDYELVIVDEASMINSHLHSLNLQRAKMYNVKVLYVGKFIAHVKPI